MVHSLVIHSLLPGTCRVFYSTTFCCDHKANGRAENRSDRKEKVLAIAQRVQSEYTFRRVTQWEPVPDSNLESGVFRSLAGEPYDKEKVVIWLGQDNSGYALVCELDENRMLAENTLRLLYRFLHSSITAISQAAEETLRVDRITAIVNRFLPNGQLLFLNHRLIRQFEKEMDMLLST